MTTNLNSSNGFLNNNITVPNVTLSQRNSLTNLKVGELVYVIDGTAKGLYTWNGTTWELVGSSNSGTFSGTISWNDLTDKPTLSNVATTGSYTDLSSKPTIPDISGLIPNTEKGIANGIATLSSTGKLKTDQIPEALVGALVYQGVWNAATNTPNITSSVGTKGFYYVVNVAGTTNIDGSTNWGINDWIIFNGSKWESVDNQEMAVSSVSGKTGAVTLSKSDVGLDNVNNTSDVNKPISTLVQSALDAKQSTLVSGTSIKTVNGQSLLGSGNVNVGGNSIDLIASGTIANNAAVSIKSDGTVETIALTGSPTPSFGTEQTFDTFSCETIYSVSAYNDTNKTIAVAYRNASNGYGYVIVGKVDTINKSISWGSPVSFRGTNVVQPRNMVIDNATNVVILTFVNYTGTKSEYVIGSIDSNTKTVTLGTVGTLFSDIYPHTIQYDQSSQLLMIGYVKGSASTSVAYSVGTVNISTKTITLSTEKTLSSFSTGDTHPYMSYDPTTKAVMYTWVYSTTPRIYGCVGVLDTSLKTINFGSLTTMDTAVSSPSVPPKTIINGNIVVTTYRTADYQYLVSSVDLSTKSLTHGTVTKVSYKTSPTTSAVVNGNTFTMLYDASDSSIMLYIQDYSNSAYSSFINATVNSSTKTLTISAPQRINNYASAGTVVYDKNDKVFIATYPDSTTSSSICFTKDSYTTNAQNFIGFSGNAATSGQSVNIKTPYPKISGFSGLTAGKTVYISNDGTVSHTNTLYPKIGMAISPTEILLSGNV